MSIRVLNDSECLSCGYRLRDLSEPVCPECGRVFDPDDATTYNVNPLLRRRRRIKRLVVMLVTAGVVLFAIWPRGYYMAQVTFVDSVTGDSIDVNRWEPYPPRWLPIPYPGVYWTTRTPDADSNTTGTGLFSITVKSGASKGGSTVWKTVQIDGKKFTLNDVQPRPENAAALLRACTNPDFLTIREDKVDPADSSDGA